MPNHCYNRVELSNNAENDSKQFKELVAKFESEKPFSKILPQPDWKTIKNEDGELPVIKEFRDDKGRVSFTTMEFPKSGKNDDRWYSWCINNWGTKWDAYDFCDIDVDEECERAEFCFNTAWGPAEGIYQYIVDHYPDVDVSWFYDEPGMEIAGYLPN
tara:strand:+ start:300 stop:773 length:474 start_codon:yes stop_codon:yes gene_type:complete